MSLLLTVLIDNSLFFFLLHNLLQLLESSLIILCVEVLLAERVILQILLKKLYKVYKIHLNELRPIEYLILKIAIINFISLFYKVQNCQKNNSEICCIQGYFRPIFFHPSSLANSYAPSLTGGG